MVSPRKKKEVAGGASGGSGASFSPPPAVARKSFGTRAATVAVKKETTQQKSPPQKKKKPDSPPPDIEPEEEVVQTGEELDFDDDEPYRVESVPAPKISEIMVTKPEPVRNRHLEASKRTRAEPEVIRGSNAWKRRRAEKNVSFSGMKQEVGDEDDFFYDDANYVTPARTGSGGVKRVAFRPMEEVSFDEDDEMKFSENGCPVYCSMTMTLSLAQQLIFKEDKDLDRCCTKVPNTYCGQKSVYLLNLQDCDEVRMYCDIASDVYGSWGGCAVRCFYFKYLEDGSVERVDSGNKAQDPDWDFSIQENIYGCHPATKNLNSQFKKKIFTVRYNGKMGEIVKTWAIIAYEWSKMPLDIEFPQPKRGKFRTGPAVVREGGSGDMDDDDDEDDGTVKYSGNGCPVYTSKQITQKLAEEIIFDPDKRLDLCCDKVPSGFVGRKSVFLLNLQKMRNVNVFGDITVDSYGSWGSCNANCWYYRYGDDDTVERIASSKNGKRPGPEVKWDFILQENSYPCHPQTRDMPTQFKRKVYTIRDKRCPGELVKTWAVIGYVWTGQPIKFEVAPHGNCKKDGSIGVGFQRTRPTVRKILEEKLHAGYSPKDVFAQAHEELGGIVGADTAADLPSSKKQVYNISRYLRKANLIPTTKELREKKAQFVSEKVLPTEPWDPSKTNNQFIVEYDYENNEPIALCTDDRMMTVFKMYCLLDQNEHEIRPLYIDTTFELGPTFVTPVFTQHPEFEEKLGQQREPIVPIAYLVSKSKLKDEFRWLGETLKKHSGAVDTDRVSAVITDDDPEMFGGLSECSLFDEPCCFILCGVNLQNNVRSVLEECRIDPNEATTILGQIFGKEHQFSVDKGRIRRSERSDKGLIDSRTVQEFDEMLEEYEQYWDPTFYNWFVRYKVPYIRNRFFVSGNEDGTGWINANRIEAMKFHFQHSLGGNFSEDNIVESLKTYSERSAIEQVRGFDRQFSWWAGGRRQRSAEVGGLAIARPQTSRPPVNWRSKPFTFKASTEEETKTRNDLNVYAKLEGAPFDLGEYQVKNELNRWVVKSEGTHFNETPKSVRILRLEEFGLNKLPKERTEVFFRPTGLSLPLNENLKIPFLVGAFAGRVTQCERAAAKFIAEECVKQLKNKAQFAVEDVVASISAIFVVERRRQGSFKCQFGFQACEAFKMFRSCFCEHTVAVAEFIGELSEHIDFINETFPDSAASAAAEVSFGDSPQPLVVTAPTRSTPVVSIKQKPPPKKVIEVVNPLLIESGEMKGAEVVKTGKVPTESAPRLEPIRSPRKMV